MREGNRSRVSGGATCTAPCAGCGSRRAPRWIVCFQLSVAGASLRPQSPCAGISAHGEACGSAERGSRIVHALLHVANLRAQVTDEALHAPRLRVRPI